MIPVGADQVKNTKGVITRTNSLIYKSILSSYELYESKLFLPDKFWKIHPFSTTDIFL